MGKKYSTIRIWNKTLKKLRILHALTGDSMVSILDEIVNEELVRHEGLPVELSSLEDTKKQEGGNNG